jgi:hypothetical protein
MSERTTAADKTSTGSATGSPDRLDIVVLESDLAPPPLGFPRCPARGC